MTISTGGIIGIALAAAVVLGLGGWAWKSNSNAKVVAENAYNRAAYATELDERFGGGGKKSKHRKHRKNASKKRR
jgi:hypothetical protein